MNRHTVTIKKVSDTIKNIKLGKIPVLDELSGVYYKCFEDKLLQPF